MVDQTERTSLLVLVAVTISRKLSDLGPTKMVCYISLRISIVLMIALYSFTNPGYSAATGHFTQIVWKGTTKIGCAAATCSDGTIFTGYKANSTYVVCEYIFM